MLERSRPSSEPICIASHPVLLPATTDIAPARLVFGLEGCRPALADLLFAPIDSAPSGSPSSSPFQPLAVSTPALPKSERTQPMEEAAVDSQPTTASSVTNREPNGSTAPAPSESAAAQPQPRLTSKIYIGGLPETTNVEDLKDCFSQLGSIRSVDLKKGFGFVVRES